MIVIVQSRWNQSITDRLAEGAEKFLSEKGLSTKRILVPGALEIPLTVEWLCTSSSAEKIDGIVTVGCVIRGETKHFDLVAEESSRALMNLSLKYRIPLGHGILAVYDSEQAQQRAGGRHGNKGEEAADAVFAMIQLKASLKNTLEEKE